MSDKRKNNGGKRPGAGQKGFGYMAFIRKKVELNSEKWWKQWSTLMNAKGKYAFEKKKFAMQEFNKLQAKMIPTQIEGGDEPIKHVFKWIK